MTSWYERARVIILEANASLPEDAGLHERRQACLRAKPYEYAVTSHGTKAWAKAQREYLVKFGYVPKTKKAMEGIPLLSPLEVEKAKYLSTRKPAAGG